MEKGAGELGRVGEKGRSVYLSRSMVYSWHPAGIGGDVLDQRYNTSYAPYSHFYWTAKNINRTITSALEGGESQGFVYLIYLYIYGSIFVLLFYFILFYILSRKW